MLVYQMVIHLSLGGFHGYFMVLGCSWPFFTVPQGSLTALKKLTQGLDSISQSAALTAMGSRWKKTWALYAEMSIKHLEQDTEIEDTDIPTLQVTDRQMMSEKLNGSRC